MSEFDRVVIITGGSRGIGRAIALALAGSKSVMLLNHYDPDDSEAEKTLEMLKPLAAQAEAFRFDISSSDRVNEFYEDIIKRFGRIDVLVNNAGITADNFLVRMKESEWDRVLNIDLKGAYLMTQQAAKVMMKQRSGRIVSISSVVGAKGNIGQVNYSAAKAGLIAMTKTAAMELAGRGITVNAVAPGFIDTEMTAVLPQKIKDEFLRNIPMGRMGTVDEIAGVVAFLVSDAATYVTGQTIHINGGLYL
ncbi:MAG: 3-oxoacyl-[acyl-carrier-protein] reductase [Deltaproteobacteria bacterium]|nr:3-oxoacyl-[acyl-carrier-protein] reductase [Deltaproteobacteria bacterium]MBF0525269.1 3-oxoacyl-[acyl-carrier-protein] reductase [Deltaproteobacteria bacterium]